MLLTLLALLQGIKGDLNAKNVAQTPPDMIKFTGESVTSEINCSHRITGYDRTFWYKQDKHGAMKLLGFLNLHFPSIEEDVKDKITMSGDGRSDSSLSISDLIQSDSAVYFCAASLHSDTGPQHVLSKTNLSLEHSFL